MKDFPSSGSSSGSEEEDDPRAKGLTVAAQNLGEGATLYLQSMKTFSIMFAVLTIINMPLYVMFQSTTDNNNFLSISQVFSYFTLGNVGVTDNSCGFSKINPEDLDYESRKLSLDCPDGSYISEIKNLGFLYHYDKRLNGNSTGESLCYAAEHQDAKPKAFPDEDYVDQFSASDSGRRRLRGQPDLAPFVEYSDDVAWGEDWPLAHHRALTDEPLDPPEDPLSALTVEECSSCSQGDKFFCVVNNMTKGLCCDPSEDEFSSPVC
mmetsp:Transcript_4428/g.6506  ORF Transcript_4428/g.6506 Transcript_4428/m.6506 type:complete len:264 (+) Transcript_4428:2247-3038(+)